MDPNGYDLISKDLLEPLYDAPTDPKMWAVFLQEALHVLKADKAAVVIHAPKNESTSIFVQQGWTPEMREATERLTRLSPWMTEIQKHQEQGWYSGSPEDILPMATFRKSKYYTELLRKHDVEWVASTVIFHPGGWMPNFTVSRSRTGAPFNDHDKELLRHLVPHLRRVFKAQRAIGLMRARNAAGRHALDLIGAAWMALDALGRVLSINRRAEAMIEDGSLLRIKGSRLVTAVSAEQKELDKCLLKACACGAGKSAGPGEGAVVLHSEEGRTLYVSVLPYCSEWAILDGWPAAVLFITTPEEQGQGEHRLWQMMFGLSPAECRVAEMMKQGMEVAEISEAIRIKVDTVRYYQKCIYRKMDVKGQGSMMRLLTRLPSTSP